MGITIHQLFLLARDWSKHVTWPNIPQLDPGNTRECSQFSKLRALQKRFEGNKHNSLHLGWKYAPIIVLGYYLFLVTVFLELRSRKTVRFSEKIISEDKCPGIFSCQMEVIVYISLHRLVRRKDGRDRENTASSVVLERRRRVCNQDDLSVCLGNVMFISSS